MQTNWGRLAAPLENFASKKRPPLPTQNYVFKKRALHKITFLKKWLLHEIPLRKIDSFTEFTYVKTVFSQKNIKKRIL